LSLSSIFSTLIPVLFVSVMSLKVFYLTIHIAIILL
jgi:hypothetical protein